MTLLIGDISSHNTITSWPALLTSVDGVIVKVSQNNDYTWAGSAAALSQARRKLSGAYHYAGPSPSVRRPPQAPTVEADFFLANYAHTPGEVVVCDFEPQVPPADPDGWVHDWCQRVLDRIGVLPWVYLNGALARSGPWTRTRGLGCQLWVAQYGANTGAVPSPAPPVGSWGSYVGWQYTSAGSRPGVSGQLDLSQFYIDAAAWRAAGTPGGNDMPLTNDDVAKIMNWPLGPFLDSGDLTFGQFLLKLPDFLQNATGGDLRSIIGLLKAEQSATVDPVALAAALLADPAGVAKLGDAIAAGLATRIHNG